VRCSQKLGAGGAKLRGLESLIAHRRKAVFGRNGHGTISRRAKMTDVAWKKTLLILDENEARVRAMPPAEPAPMALWCRESPHRTLGHLTACQAAWLPLMLQIQAGATHGTIVTNPDPLYTKLGFKARPWSLLIGQFVSERAQWREILSRIDPTLEIQTSRRVHSAQTLTRRMVEHEKRHLDALLR